MRGPDGVRGAGGPAGGQDGTGSGDCGEGRTGLGGGGAGGCSSPCFAVLLELPLLRLPVHPASRARPAIGEGERAPVPHAAPPAEHAAPPVAHAPDQPGEWGQEAWERRLWFRFEVRVAGWGLVWESRRWVDVVVDPAREQPVVLEQEGEDEPLAGAGARPARWTGSHVPGAEALLPPAVPVQPAPAGLAWVSDYELSRWAPLALAAAVAVARQEACRLRQAMQPFYEAEAQRLASHFARRRDEVLAGAMGMLRRLERASALAMLASPNGPRTPARDLQRLAQLAAARWRLARERLSAVEQERRRAMSELRARIRPTATVSAAGLAVWWARVAGPSP